MQDDLELNEHNLEIELVVNWTIFPGSTLSSVLSQIHTKHIKQFLDIVVVVAVVV